jgi:hypothetical protein
LTKSLPSCSPAQSGAGTDDRPTELPAGYTWGDFAAFLAEAASDSNLTEKDRGELLQTRDEIVAKGPAFLASLGFKPDPVDLHVERQIAKRFPDMPDDERAALRQQVLEEYAKLTEHEVPHAE